MRRVLTILLGVPVLSLIPATAYAGGVQPIHNRALVVVSGHAYVTTDEVVPSVVVFKGSANIDGSVTGSVVVFSGPAVISGDVGGDVIVFDGMLTLQDGAHVSGDVFADRRTIAPGAQIDGTTQSETKLTVATGWAGVAILIAMWLAVSLSLLLFGMLLLWFAPRAADAAIAVGRTAVGPSIGWGAAMVFGLPIIAVVAIVTVIGLPIGLGILFALGLVYAIGMVTGSWFLGRMIVKTGSRIGAFALGWAIVTVASLIPGVSGLAWLAATGYGLGILCVAAFRAREGPSDPITVRESMPSAPTSA